MGSGWCDLYRQKASTKPSDNFRKLKCLHQVAFLDHCFQFAHSLVEKTMKHWGTLCRSGLEPQSAISFLLVIHHLWQYWSISSHFAAYRIFRIAKHAPSGSPPPSFSYLVLLWTHNGESKRLFAAKQLSTATHAKDPWPSITAASQGIGSSWSKATIKFQICDVFVRPESLCRSGGVTEGGTIL